MSLSIISPFNKDEENQIQANIFKSIDDNENIIFSSGAGAGKTYALIESLKYIINHHGKKLKEHNQMVVCITYTNIATEEVKDRLGNSDLVKVSTIHERVWELIKSHQKELAKIHKEKLKEEITKLETGIKENSKFEKYRALGREQQESFKELMLDRKSIFYENYSEKSKIIKEAFQDDLEAYPDMLKNIANFKKIVSSIYRFKSYTDCIANIESRTKGYEAVEYSSIHNKDMLHRMRISHDTLLEYGLKIIEKHLTLRQMVIDQYPFILIDEYQDTNEQVIKIMKHLSDHANKIKHNLLIAYFGDTAQNIYDDGIGNKIDEIHPGLKQINKDLNRRSTKEVIDTINKIRNDNITQKSIYDDCEGGSVKFYTGRRNDIKGFTEQLTSEWSITPDNRLHCLVLTNKTVAEFSGFINIYEAFKNTKHYTQHYEQINTELLSNDLSKLGVIPNLLFRIIELRNKLKNHHTPVQEVLPENILKGMSIAEMRELIELLKQNEGDTLGNYVKSISTTCSKTDNIKYKALVNKTFETENFSYEIFLNHIFENLYLNLKDDDSDDAAMNIQNLLEIKLDEYDLWYNFILSKLNDKVAYHTYHGTKGLEFDNVLIIMENAFGKDKKYFNTFFNNYCNSDTLEGVQKNKFEKVQNLLYVSCSRAIHNLRILYLDDISGFDKNLNSIFGKLYQYEAQSA